jgi:hypothetical protein
MPATTEQWEEIQSLKAAHSRQLAEFDEECRRRRVELEAEHNAEFDELYKRFGGRRDRSINEGKLQPKQRRAA